MSSVPLDLARRALQTRATLPADVDVWRRAFAITPGEATRLVRAEQARRRASAKAGRAA